MFDTLYKSPTSLQILSVRLLQNHPDAERVFLNALKQTAFLVQKHLLKKGRIASTLLLKSKYFKTDAKLGKLIENYWVEQLFQLTPKNADMERFAVHILAYQLRRSPEEIQKILHIPEDHLHGTIQKLFAIWDPSDSALFAKFLSQDRIEHQPTSASYSLNHLKLLIALQVSQMTSPVQSRKIEQIIEEHPEIATLQRHYTKTYDCLILPMGDPKSPEIWKTWITQSRKMWRSEPSPKTCPKWQKTVVSGFGIALTLFWVLANFTFHKQLGHQQSGGSTTSTHASQSDLSSRPDLDLLNSSQSLNPISANLPSDRIRGTQIQRPQIHATALSKLQSYEWMIFNFSKQQWPHQTESPISYVVVSPQSNNSQAENRYRYLLTLVDQYDLQPILVPRKLNLESFLPRTVMLIGPKRWIDILISALQGQDQVQITTENTPWAPLRPDQNRVLIHIADSKDSPEN